MAKELIVDKFKLYTAKKMGNNKQKKILLVSDLHIGKNSVNDYGKEDIRLLEKYLEESSDVDVVLVPGDLVNGAKSYLNPEYMNQLRYVISMLRDKAPTVISKGNHDLYGDNDEVAKAFKSLEEIKDVFPLDNEQLELDGAVYTGFSPNLDAYNIMNYGKKANQAFVRDWQEQDFKFKPDDLNILLEHDPLTISSSEALDALDDDLKNITMIASGHLHNGFITNWHEKKSKYKLMDGGYWESPLTGFKIDTCRGAYLIGRKNKGIVYLPGDEYYKAIETLTGNECEKALLVVSKGFSKYPLSKRGGDPNVTEVVLENTNYQDDNINEPAYGGKK